MNQQRSGGGRCAWIIPITVALITATGGILAALISNPQVLDRFAFTLPQPAAVVDASTSEDTVDEEAQPVDEAEAQPVDEAEPPPDEGCVVTIGNPLVSLMSDPDTFSQEIIRVPAGEYATLDFQEIEFAGNLQGWFQIEADGRTGWIKNDTWTIAGKSDACP